MLLYCRVFCSPPLTSDTSSYHTDIDFLLTGSYLQFVRSNKNYSHQWIYISAYIQCGLTLDKWCTSACTAHTWTKSKHPQKPPKFWYLVYFGCVRRFWSPFQHDSLFIESKVSIIIVSRFMVSSKYNASCVHQTHLLRSFTINLDFYTTVFIKKVFLTKWMRVNIHF